MSSVRSRRLTENKTKGRPYADHTMRSFCSPAPEVMKVVSMGDRWCELRCDVSVIVIWMEKYKKKKGIEEQCSLESRKFGTNLTGQAILQPLLPRPCVPGRRRLQI